MLPGAHRQVHPRAGGRVAIYWYATRGGDLIWKHTAESYALAEAAEIEQAPAIAKAYAEARDTRPAKGQFARVIVEYIAHPDYKDLKADTQRTYRPWLEECRAVFGAMSADKITPQAVEEWRLAIYRARGARAADHALAVFKRLCLWGRKPQRKLLPADFHPSHGLGMLYKATPQAPWPDAALPAIKAKLKPRIVWALMLALTTGLRRADLVDLRWDAIDWAAGKIRIITSKGSRRGRRAIIRLTPSLKAVLAGIPRKADEVLTNKWGRRWTVHSLGAAINRELTPMGVSGRLHGLRRSSATHLALEGLTTRQIAKQLGWSEADAEDMGAIYIDEEAASGISPVYGQAAVG